jgi:hypothetical protein
MITYVKSHPEDFEELITLAMGDKPIYSWRASWLLWSVIEKNDPRVRKHTEKIIELLPAKPDNQLRELMKTLQVMEISEDYEGILFDICLTTWESTDKQPSVRSNAFKLMAGIVKNHPELAKELFYVTSPHYLDSLSPGVKRSITKITEQLKK